MLSADRREFPIKWMYVRMRKSAKHVAFVICVAGRAWELGAVIISRSQ